MPRFKTTKDIFVTKGEYFNENWMDSNTVMVPPNQKWTYEREMHIEDVDLWEIIYERSGGVGVYASYDPLAEFYMICTGWDKDGRTPIPEVYYGPGAEMAVRKRMIELNMTYGLRQHWVDDNDIWLYNQPYKGPL
jgi:hypothetical protein